MKKAGRRGLAIAAVQKVLGTLTWVDFAGVVAFNHEVSSSNRQLVPANEVNRKRLSDWIGQLEPSGRTSFRDSLSTAMDMLGMNLSGCNGALLIRTDGTPGVWNDADYDSVRSKNKDDYVKIFTYGLGDSAKMDICETLASQNGGTAIQVPDGRN